MPPNPLKDLIQEALTTLEKGDLLCEVTAVGILRQAHAHAVIQHDIIEHIRKHNPSHSIFQVTPSTHYSL